MRMIIVVSGHMPSMCKRGTRGSSRRRARKVDETKGGKDDSDATTDIKRRINDLSADWLSDCDTA
jgi:hypothetical protein